MNTALREALRRPDVVGVLRQALDQGRQRFFNQVFEAGTWRIGLLQVGRWR